MKQHFWVYIVLKSILHLNSNNNTFLMNIIATKNTLVCNRHLVFYELLISNGLLHINSKSKI